MKRKAVLLRECGLLVAALAALGGFILSVSTHLPFYTVFAESPSATSTLWASGYNFWGQLGNGTDVNKDTLTQELTGATNWLAISAGWYHTVALKSDGTLWAWGNNEFGQLGDGTTAAARLLGFDPPNRTIPVQESTGATDWSAIASGGFDSGGEAYHTVALKSDGTLWAWGYNGNGQIGDGTTWNKDIPTQESTEATSWSAIAAGGWHTVALRSDGTLWAWGKNSYGQLGDGTVAEKHTPTQESTGATNWSAISAGFGRTVALKSDGTLWAWGKNNFGQLGDGTTAETHTPTQESTGATNWSAIAAGGYHTVAIKSESAPTPTHTPTPVLPTPTHTPTPVPPIPTHTPTLTATPTPIPSTSGWGLAALAAALLAMSAILLRLTSGHRPATRP